MMNKHKNVWENDTFERKIYTFRQYRFRKMVLRDIIHIITNVEEMTLFDI